MLESKHPPQVESSPEAFIVCEQLPTLVDIDVSSSHVYKVAKTLSGSAGIGGLDHERPAIAE